MPGYKRALFLYNGNAGNDNMEQKLSQTLPVLAKDIKELIVLGTYSIEEAQEACLEYGEGIDLLVILGGDGTVHACINTISKLNRRPVIGILPGGTSNDFSRTLEMPQNLNQAAEALMNGREKPVDVGKLEECYFLNFWGIGLVTETSFNIDKDQKSRLGVLSYFISALKTINQADPFTFQMTIDGKVVEEEAIMVLVMNGKFLGTRQIPIESIDPGDGLLDVLVIKNSNLTLFKELMNLDQPWAETESFQELSYTRGEKIEVTTSPPQQVDMDGEINYETPSTIEVIPNHLTFLHA
ncbi:diacylglycerol/lipid kinase family protein [Thalassobacillus sp. B23F22_16]|uniref:diacylglycerol/lipid kinase family protein n=1 Tax=Thalassobacillus sp. B23F22_16 TaxID=3459513 RepID=UPI00373F3878